MTWPDYPKNRLIVGGVDLSVRFQMILLDGYTLDPPEPKTYTVDIPGGDGVIDLTETILGDTAYKQRKQEFEFIIVDMQNEQTFEQRKTDVANFLHGKSFDYQMTMDPGYTYHGRFSVTEQKHSAFPSGILGAIKIAVEAEPYKLKKKMTYRLNATGGEMFYLSSGRKKVHPYIETDQPISIRYKDKVIEVGKGTFRLNDVLFSEGINEIYINSLILKTLIWDEIGKNGSNSMTWDQAKKYRWDDLQRMNVNDALQMNNAVELLTNPGFENGDIDGWTPSNSSAVTVQNRSIPTGMSPHSGNYEVKIAAGGSIQQTVYGLKAGKSISIGGWFYSVSGLISLSYVVKDKQGNILINSTNVGSVTQSDHWSRLNKSFDIPSGADSCTVTITCSNDVGYFDDMTLKQVTLSSRSWRSLAQLKWSDLVGIKWYEIDFRKTDAPKTSVLLQYDWKDL